MKRDIRENGSAETRLLLRCGTAVPTPCQIHPLGVTNTTACYRRKLYIRQTEQSAQRPWKVIVRSNHRSRATPEGAPGRDKKTAENLGIFAVGSTRTLHLLALPSSAVAPRGCTPAPLVGAATAAPSGELGRPLASGGELPSCRHAGAACSLRESRYGRGGGCP